MHKLHYLRLAIILFMVLSLLGPSFGVSAAGSSPNLGAANSFAVLAGAGISDVPTSTITGDVGLSPAAGTLYTGLTIAEVSGTIFAVDSSGPAGVAGNNPVLLTNAQNANVAAYGFLNTGVNASCTQDFGNVVTDLSGMVLVPGVYCTDVTGTTGAFTLSGTLTLKGSGVWIFRSGSTLITSGTAKVVGGDPCNVWWRVPSAATIGAHTQLTGNILALSGIQLQSGATLNGRALVQTPGAVTLNNNTITGASCRPTVTTTASGPVTVGDNITDTAHLSGGSSTVGGTIAFDVFAPGDTTCATPLTAPTGATVSGVGDYTSGNFATAALGSYRWEAHYSGDVHNLGADTACNDPNETSLVTVASTILPVTGFAPQHVTALSAQPAEKAYADLGDLWLEVPRLGVQMPIVGVPQSVEGTWDVSWLGNDAGWLQGSAFPTWTGNSVLTGHVYNADGKPGPFVYLNQMWWDDKIIVHAGGAQYIYAVRTVTQVSPNDTAAMMKHQTIPWVTLVTCRGYDQSSNSYKYRVLVRAVLVDVK